MIRIIEKSEIKKSIDEKKKEIISLAIDDLRDQLINDNDIYLRFICVSINRAIKRIIGFNVYLHFKYEGVDLEYYFPEVYKHKPEILFSEKRLNLSEIWFSTDDEGVQKRIEILENVLKELS